MLLVDRFYPSVGLFHWLSAQGWHYRLRLKGNLLADPGVADETTIGELERDVTACYLPTVRLFGQGEVMTNIGIWHEAGHPEPWIIAMDCPPTRATVLDDGSRWAMIRLLLILRAAASSRKIRNWNMRNVWNG